MSEAIEVRPATIVDAAAIQAIYAPIVIHTVTSFEESPPTVEEIARRMLAEPRFPWFVAVREGTVTGYAYASAFRARAAYRWSAECSIYLHETERGRGTGRPLYGTLFAELRELGYVSVFAAATLPNDASAGLHEAMGFVPIGIFPRVGFKHGEWHDVGWWRLELTYPPESPREPQPWGG